MRIVVNDIAATKNSGGAYSVLLDFIKEINESEFFEYEWIFLVGDTSINQEKLGIKNHVTFIERIDVKKSWLNRVCFDFYSGKKFINSLKPDIYVSLQNTPTIGVKVKQIVYFHQVIPYQRNIKFKFSKTDERIFWIYQNIGRIVYDVLFKITQANIVVQSNWLKNSMQSRIRNNIMVVPPKVEIPFSKSLKSETIINNKFFFPASYYNYKNHKVIIDAVEILNQRGIKDFQVLFTIDETKAIKYPQIECIGPISRNEVFKIMGNSILIFPSLLESYGLPLLEAKLSGTYILAPNLEYAKESVGLYKNVSYFDALKGDELANIMEEIILHGVTILSDSPVVNDGLSLAKIIVGGYDE